jgi:hypothetical protein
MTTLIREPASSLTTRRRAATRNGLIAWIECRLEALAELARTESPAFSDTLSAHRSSRHEIVLTQIGEPDRSNGSQAPEPAILGGADAGAGKVPRQPIAEMTREPRNPLTGPRFPLGAGALARRSG